MFILYFLFGNYQIFIINNLSGCRPAAGNKKKHRVYGLYLDEFSLGGSSHLGWRDNNHLVGGFISSID
jgi:hypothetical protein